MSKDFFQGEEIFLKQLDEIGLTVSDYQLEQFRKYYEILIEWNEKMNLTGITDEKGVYEKHFLDSICGFTLFDRETDHSYISGKEVISVIDVGTGAGFPGIPLKIMFPHIEMTLFDSLNKRIQFLDFVSNSLRLEKVVTVHGRAEEFGKNKEFREKFDLCVSRAVSGLPVLTEYCSPFVRKEGFFLSYKSGEIEEEIDSAENAFEKLKVVNKKIVSYKLPHTDISRSIVILKKIDHTPDVYPRKAGIPQKRPL